MPVNITYRDAGAITPSTTTVKGAPLNNAEIDGNFKAIKDALDVNLESVDTILQNGVGTVLSRQHVATATSGQTTFVLPFTYAAGINNLMVFVNGALAEVGTDYVETNTNTVTFNTGLVAGREVVFLSTLSSSGGNVINSRVDTSTYSFTSDGEISTFQLPVLVNDENETQIFVNGIYQEKTAYSVIGQTINFADPPVEGTVEVVVFSAVGVGSTNADLIAYTPAGTGAVNRTVQSKLREVVSVKDFGAVGDGVADDTAAVHAAINYAKSRRASVFFPAGTYRVTSGYTQNTSYADVHLYGEGSTRENAGGSHIRLDSTSPSSFFYLSTHRHNLQVNDLVFSCAQFVKDRAFFKLGSNTSQFFTRVNFESVERPIVWPAGAYFQSSAYRDVQFRNSGTFHSEETSLVCTLLTLDNVNHESSVPDNTEKVICNLSGVRQIQATNFLLEGVSPGAAWTVLKIGATYDGDWPRNHLVSFRGFWIEFAGANPQYAVHQTNGRVVIQGANSFLTPTSKYKLDGKGAVEFRNYSFSATADDPASMFELQDYLCQVAFYDCNARNFGLTKTKPNFTLVNCSEARDGLSLLLVATNFSNTKSQKLWEFDGGFIDSGMVTVNAYSGTGFPYPSVDAKYGRKLVVTPISATNLFSLVFQAKVFGVTEPGQQWFFLLRMKLPTFTAGTVLVQYTDDYAEVGNFAGYGASFSGQEVSLVAPVADIAGGSSLLGFTIGAAGSPAGVSGNLEIYYAAIFLGKDVPHTTIPSFPNIVTTRASAAPTVGEWKRGDRVLNSSPAVGQPKSWVCTVAGTPGTWVSEGNL